MQFVSSRNKMNVVLAETAIVKGLAEDGGLFTPIDFNSRLILDDIKNKSYKDIAEIILTNFFDTLDKNKIKNAINNAYDKFDTKDVTPTKKVSDKNGNDDFYLELFHGPTSAFKDVALTMLPHLLTISYDKLSINKKVYILCATSGDTGKAALEGFKDVNNTYITVFYPNKSVSKIQELQMSTTTGNNTNVVSVNGNFDDCQKVVKSLMKESDELLKDKNVLFSSANSINIGRLVPQIVYYIKSYFDLVNTNEIKLNEKINFCVPTGNFGDILAGYIAKRIGLPIDKLICASNKNNILTDFLNTGIYDARRKFYNTNSPSMDIIISSNLERLLYIESGYDDKFIKKIMEELDTNKVFDLNKNFKDVYENIKKTFVGYFADVNETNATIKKVYDEYNYLIDTHTAVAKAAKDKFANDENIDETSRKNKTVILSTASPYKFCTSVYNAINGNLNNNTNIDEFEIMTKLENETNTKAPKNLCSLNTLPILHSDNIDKEEAREYIQNKIDILNNSIKK